LVNEAALERIASLPIFFLLVAQLSTGSGRTSNIK
jgi:hypothetical protein